MPSDEGIDKGVARRQKERKRRIILIKTAVMDAKKLNLEIDFKKLVITVMSKLIISERTARELVNVALFELGLSKETINEK